MMRQRSVLAMNDVCMGPGYLRDLRYESLIVFIYDDSASVHHAARHCWRFSSVADVAIVSRPQPDSKSDSLAIETTIC